MHFPPPRKREKIQFKLVFKLSPISRHSLLFICDLRINSNCGKKNRLNWIFFSPLLRQQGKKYCLQCLTSANKETRKKWNIMTKPRRAHAIAWNSQTIICMLKVKYLFFRANRKKQIRKLLFSCCDCCELIVLIPPSRKTKARKLKYSSKYFSHRN